MRIAFSTACALAAALLAFPVMAQQDYGSGNFWITMCAPNTQNYVTCTQYVRGVRDGVTFMESWTKGKKRPYCAPAEISAGQSADIFYKYLVNHPETRHLYGSVLVVEALREAFPCTKTK